MSESLNKQNGVSGLSTGSLNASNQTIVRNVLSGYAANLVGMVTGLVVTPILLGQLGVSQFGLWVLLGSTVGYTALAEFGLRTTVAKRVADCLAVDDTERLASVVSTACVIFVGVAALILLVTVSLAWNLGNLFQIPQGLLRPAQSCIIVMGCSQAFAMAAGVQYPILYGAGRLDVLSGITSVLFALVGLANAVLVLMGYGLVALALAAACSTLLGVAAGFWSVRRVVPQVRISFAAVSRRTAFELYRYGLRNFLISFGGTVSYGADALVLGLLLPVGAVAQYAIASKLVSLVKAIASKPADVLMPSHSHAHALDDHARQFALFRDNVKLSLAFALPVVASFCVFGDRIVTAWVGPGHLESFPILVVLALVLLFELPSAASGAVLIGSEQNQFLVKLILLGMPVNLGLSIALTHALGPVGVALGSLVTVAANGTFLPWDVCRKLDIPYREYMRQSILPLVLPLFIVMSLAVVTRPWAGHYGRVGVLAALCGVSAPGWYAFWRTGLRDDQRRTISTRFRSIGQAPRSN